MDLSQQKFICEGKTVKLPISLKSKFLESLYEDDDTLVELDFIKYDFMMIFNKYYNNITKETNQMALEKTGCDIYYINSLVSTYLQINKIHSIKKNDGEVVRIELKYYPTNYIYTSNLNEMNFDDRFLSLDNINMSINRLMKEENYEYLITKRDNLNIINSLWNYATKNNNINLLFFIIDFTKFYGIEDVANFALQMNIDILDIIVGDITYF